MFLATNYTYTLSTMHWNVLTFMSKKPNVIGSSSWVTLFSDCAVYTQSSSRDDPYEVDVQICYYPLNFVCSPLQHITGHIRMVSACSRVYDKHFIMLLHWDITTKAHSYDTQPVTLFWQQANLSTLCQISQWSYKLKSIWFHCIHWEPNPGPPRHWNLIQFEF